jgi:hypothetical protein
MKEVKDAKNEKYRMIFQSPEGGNISALSK